ncbi:MAG TPA: hypothetical protein VM537_35960 [Anaerolineae bacterium]|nr:hypothetical protein [Anaerolineae bacterium]
MARFDNAGDIINRAALEIGLVPVSDPVGSTDEAFIQLTGLLTSAGQEMVELHPWQVLTSVFEFTTTDLDTGSYDLPDDYSYMIDQTGWDRTNKVMISGPLSPQDWTYLKGRDLVNQTIYASFRLMDAKFDLFPQPPPVGLQVSFEYINRNWVRLSDDSRADSIQNSSDTVLYEPILIIKFLKAKFLEAKGFDPSSARLEFENMMNSRTGKDTGAPILSAGRNGRGYPYLNSLYNTPDTGYGRT